VPAITDVMTLSRRGDSMANARRHRPKYANTVHKKVFFLKEGVIAVDPDG
jgi:hypothetical protein